MSIAPDLAPTPRRRLIRPVSVGKQRGFQQLASADGVLALCAMDHGAILDELFTRLGRGVPSRDDVALLKRDVCEALAPEATGIVLDPTVGAPTAIAAGVLPGGTGLVVSADAEAVADEDGARWTELLPGWTPTAARRLGAAAAKLTVYYNPGHAAAAARQRRVARTFVDACRAEDLVSLVEVFIYPLSATDPAAFAEVRPGLIAEAAGELSALGADLLALEFPALAATDRSAGRREVRLAARKRDGRDLAACRAVDAASDAPWLVASAGVETEEYARQVQIACRAGASGFLAGRVMWELACASAHRGQRRWWLDTHAAPRLRALAAAARGTAAPWWSRWGPEPVAICEGCEGMSAATDDGEAVT